MVAGGKVHAWAHGEHFAASEFVAANPEALRQLDVGLKFIGVMPGRVLRTANCEIPRRAPAENHPPVADWPDETAWFFGKFV